MLRNLWNKSSQTKEICGLLYNLFQEIINVFVFLFVWNLKTFYITYVINHKLYTFLVMPEQIFFWFWLVCGYFSVLEDKEILKIILIHHFSFH